MSKQRLVFHLERVPFEETDARGCVRLYQKEVDSSEEMVRAEDDKGEFIGNFWDRYRAFDRVHELTRGCSEWAMFE